MPVYDVSTAQGAGGSPHQLYMHNCDVAASSVGGGIYLDPSVPTAANLSDGQVHNVKFGIKLNAGTLSSGSGVNAIIDGMELFGFGTNAIVVNGYGSGVATASVSRSTISQSMDDALYLAGTNAAALLYGDTVTLSTIGIQNAANGAAYTFGNSAIFANSANVSGSLTAIPAGVGGKTQ